LFRLQSKANISDPYNINDNPDPTASRVAALQTYLSSAAVQQALNVVPAESSFVFCGQTAYNALATDEERYAGYQLRWAIDNGLYVTAYNGELDLICDWIGTRNYTTVLGFKGQEAFNAAPNGNWTTVFGGPAGLVQTLGNVALVTVANAGHMVPFDQPVSAFTLLRRALAWHW